MLKNLSRTDEEKKKLRLVELFNKNEGKGDGNSDDEVIGSTSILKSGEGSSKHFGVVFDELKKITQKQDLLTNELNAFKASIDKKFDTIFVCLKMMFDKFEIHTTDGDDDEVWYIILSIFYLYYTSLLFFFFAFDL